MLIKNYFKIAAIICDFFSSFHFPFFFFECDNTSNVFVDQMLYATFIDFSIWSVYALSEEQFPIEKSAHNVCMNTDNGVPYG